MRRLKFVLLGLIAVVGVVYVIGWLLPVGHVASASATFSRAPQEIYVTVADVAGYPRWWSEITSVEMLPSDEGRIRFREHMSTGPIVMEVVEATPPTRFVTRIADPDQPFGGTWTFAITPEQNQTRLTITERGEVYDPLFRFLSRFVFGHTGTMESFLAALREHFGA